ncbi:MFS transporter [Streptomyces spirodelae]|uniref:MFS transporter n=1 Tax=Streptomyces spirodelae TaxID=2812904 RepID=A0ABS3X0K5_9ACTN|nr:MFS transporter [Streptomyces spirodelae]MBO8188915.1 MFS transporter [Streptomyces spirodelae]
MTLATARPAPARQAPPTRAARAAVLASATLTLMAAAIIAPGLPAMSEEFAEASGAGLLVRFVVTITSLAIAVSAPVSGLIADRVGRRSLLVSGLVLYAVSGTAGFFATNLYVLLATRVLLGVAVGGIMTAISATITDWFEGARRASFLGLQQAFASLGGVVFLPLGGVLAGVDWRAPFWLYAVSGAVAVLAFVALREGPRGRGGTGPAAGEAPLRGRTPQRSGTGRIVGVYLLALVATLAFYMGPTQLPFLLQDFGSGPGVAGAVIAGSTVSGTFGALAFPYLRRRLATTAITAIGVALLGTGWLLVGAAGTVVQVLAGMLVGGTGVGLVVPNLNLLLSELAPDGLRGRVLSGLVTGIFLGQFFSPLALQPLVQATGLAAAFTWTGAAMAAGATLAGLTAGLVRQAPRVRRRSHHTPTTSLTEMNSGKGAS